MCVILRDTQMIFGVHHKNLFMLFFNMRDLFFLDCGKNPLFCFCFICFLYLSCKQMYHLVIWHFFISKSHLNYKKAYHANVCRTREIRRFFFFFCKVPMVFRIFAYLPLCVSACCSLWVRISVVEIYFMVLAILFCACCSIYQTMF